MTTIIYFVRHGEYKNPNNINPGRISGYRLSVNGIEQIERAAEFFRGKEISDIYSSPILRTRQTAGIIRNKLGLSRIKFSNFLLEVKSSFDGASRANLAKTNFDFYSSNTTHSKYESIKDIEQRMTKFVNKIVRMNIGKKIVAVSHGDPIMIIRASILGMPLTLKSIREPKKGYLGFGEVFKVTIAAHKKWKIEKVLSKN